MPAKDRTGPRGEGPMTGRGLGDCNPNATNQRPLGLGGGRGLGRGRGRGLGYRNQVKNE
jgi:hypothetical protein